MAYNTRFYVGLSLHLTMQNETMITNINKFKKKKKRNGHGAAQKMYILSLRLWE